MEKIDTAIYWVYFTLPNHRGEMFLSIEAATKEIATSLGTEKAMEMNEDWVFDRTICVR